MDLPQGELPTREEVERDTPEPQPGRMAPHEGDTDVEFGGHSVGASAHSKQPERQVSPAASLTQRVEEPLAPEPSIEVKDPASIPAPEDIDEDLLFGDTECFLAEPTLLKIRLRN